MPEDRSRPSIPAWKQAVPSTERKDSTRPAWRKEAAPAAAPRESRTRRTKLAVGALGLIIASAALVAVILWLRPHKPACLVLLGADYIQTGDGKGVNLAIPHNAYGWQSLKALQETTEEIVNIKHPPAQLRLDSPWNRDLDTVREKTLIIYLAMHGGADSQGAFFLPQDTDLGAPEQRLRLEAILDRLQELPVDKKKVLVLDVTQVLACWTLGMLHNDFVRALQSPETQKRIEGVPNLVVLCASDVDQQSWIAPDWRCTIFAHFVREGLRGAADADNNGRVTAWELAEYVKRNVQRWTRANWGELQTPLLLGGENRARNIELANVRHYQPLDANDTPAARAPMDLARIEKAWQTCRELEASTPAPAIYSPHLWRQYLDTLLLYEQLIRAGAEDRLALVKDQLDRLGDEVHRAGRLPLPSMQNAVAMPAALGLPTAWDAKTANTNLRKLWDAPAGQRAKNFEGLLQGVGDAQGPQLARLQLCGSIAERLASRDSTLEDLKTANELLHVIGATGNARPAEAHFLAMLVRDLDSLKAPPERLFGQALELRRVAEDTAFGVDPSRRVHPYSEYVFPWVQTKIEQADERRQQGQDKLFATQNSTWDEAGQLLKEARDGQKPDEGYVAARKDAARVQDALATCHQVFAFLPYYSHWLAGRRVSDKAQVEAVEELWKETHYLARLLRGDLSASQNRPQNIRIAVSVDANDQPPRSLEDRTKAIGKSFKAREDSFAELCRKLEDPPSAELQTASRQIEEALTVPRIRPEQRLALLRKAQQTEHKFHLETADESQRSSAQMSTEENRKEAWDQMQREGRLALAVLGMRWFDDTSLFEANNRYIQVRGMIEKLVPETDWSKDAVRAGEEIGLRWRRMPERINRLTEAARKEKLEPAAADLAQAEDLARKMEGGLVAHLTGNPVDGNRRLQLHNFLLWQAERTLRDHWFAENRTDEPYYRFAGNLYVRDAKSLVEGQRGELNTAQLEDRVRAVVKMQELLQLGTLAPALVDARRPEITSEQHLPLAYKLKPEGWLPEGFPVVWMTDDKLLRLRDNAGRGRRVLKTNGKEPSAPEPFDLEPEKLQTPALSPRTDVARVKFEGRYRGQVIDLETPVNLHRLPDAVVYDHPRPSLAALAVRADAELHEQFAPQNGALAIVMDCTGSMNMPKADTDAFKPYDRTTPCKWHEATDALRKVLRDMQKGTTVSVWVFGHARGKRNDKGYPVEEQPDARTQPLDTLEQFRKPSAWDAAQLTGLINKLDNLFPFNETPLLRVMHEVKNADFQQNFKGFKSLLVITDGEDNCFAKDKALHQLYGTDDIEKFIEKDFKDSGIRPILVGFKVPPAEQEPLEKFKRSLNKLPLKGEFFFVDDVNDLAPKLQKYMKQDFRFLIERDGGGSAAPDLQQAMPEGGFDITRSEENDKPIYIKPGTYRIRVLTQRPLEKRIQLDEGDFLRLKFTPAEFERVPLADDFPFKPRREVGGWLLSIPQNQLKAPDNGLEMMLTLEHAARIANTLKLVRPRRVWLEVKPQDVEKRIGLRWGSLPGYGAQAWDVRVSEWPTRLGAAEPARPVVNVWWNENNTTAGSVDQIVREPNADISSFGGKESHVGADATDRVVIENVQVESQSVESPTGSAEPVSALVVRLRYPAGKPCWVEIEGLDLAGGMEHRFYTQANKCTSVFWPVTEGTAKDHLKALQVYSLERFKSKPTLTTEVQVENLPSQGERRPPPVFVPIGK